LGRRRADALRALPVERDLQLFGDEPGDLERLVVTPIAQARYMQRDRYHYVGKRIIECQHMFREISAEHAREFETAVVFEVLNQPVHR